MRAFGVLLSDAGNGQAFTTTRCQNSSVRPVGPPPENINSYIRPSGEATTPAAMIVSLVWRPYRTRNDLCAAKALKTQFEAASPLPLTGTAPQLTPPRPAIHRLFQSITSPKVRMNVSWMCESLPRYVEQDEEDEDNTGQVQQPSYDSSQRRHFLQFRTR